MRTNPVNLRLTDADLEAIGEEEGWVGYAYDDADPKATKTFITPENVHLVKGTLTIGHGHTGTVKPGMRVDRAQGLALLRSDVRDAESCVHRYVRVPLTPGEFAAMVDLFYNVGPGTLPNERYPKGKDGIACLGKSGGGRPSTLLSLLNKCDPAAPDAEANYAAVAGCFTQWVMPGSIFEWGLTKRRIRMMLRFMGLPTMRAELSFPNGPVPTAMRYDLVQRCIALAREELADKEAMEPAAPVAPPPAPVVPATVKGEGEVGVPSPTPPRTLPSEIEEIVASAPADSPLTIVVENEPPKPSPASPVVKSEPASSKAEGGAGGVSSPAQLPAPSVATPLPPLPKAPVVIQPKTIDLNSIPYGQIDPSNGAKNLTDSKRFIGMVIVAGGSLVQVLAAREVVSSTIGAIFFDLSRDPVIVALAAGGVLWLVGHLTRKRGQKVITDGMVSATTVLK